VNAVVEYVCEFSQFLVNLNDSCYFMSNVSCHGGPNFVNEIILMLILVCTLCNYCWGKFYATIVGIVKDFKAKTVKRHTVILYDTP